MPIAGKQQGKAAHQKAPKADRQEMDEDDIAFKQKQKSEQKKLQEAAAKLQKKK